MDASALLTTVILTDSTTINFIIKSALDLDKFDVHILKSADPDFFAEILRLKPRLVFIRTELSHAKGIDVCDLVKNSPLLKETSVIFLSSNHDIREIAIEHRADRFLKVPFQPQDVRDVTAHFTARLATILYVDDSDMFHKVVVPALKDEGYRVLEAWDGREALDIIDRREEPIHLILSDVEMPEVDGLALCQNVRNSLTEDIPFVLLTSLGTEEAISRGFAAGADDYIIKPVVIPELLTRVKRLLTPNATSEMARPERILVVDDSEVIRNMIGKALRTHGFEVEEAEHGLAALNKISQRKYHLMVTDYEMPQMDGVELCLNLRKIENTFNRMPIIFATSRTGRTDLVKMRSIGIQAFVAKPFNSDRIVAEVERVLAEARLETKRTVLSHYFEHGKIPRLADAHSGEETIADDQFRMILYAGIANFAQLARSMNSLELVALINHYFDCMAQVMARHDASPEKFVEDRFFTSFGCHDDGGLRAVSTAVDMLEAVQGLNGKTGHEIKIRMGLHAGHVIVGNIGPQPHDRSLTLLGENLRIARSLKNAAKENEILLSDTALKIVKEVVTTGAEQEVRIMGGGTILVHRLESVRKEAK
ncbi:MAG: adenylate/guanylate cyclase [Magnetococcales bacterium]|nr:adenylate/guanylate cyclase [Magnetococcales bacterium]HIJ82935.1 response regulator [Magnetococcales bacterium]